MTAAAWAAGAWADDAWALHAWEGMEEQPEEQPSRQGGGSVTYPWRWVPFRPVVKPRPRRKKSEEVLFLGG